MEKWFNYSWILLRGDKNLQQKQEAPDAWEGMEGRVEEAFQIAAAFCTLATSQKFDLVSQGSK